MNTQIEYDKDTDTFILDNGVAIIELTRYDLGDILKEYRKVESKIERENNEKNPKYYGGL